MSDLSREKRTNDVTPSSSSLLLTPSITFQNFFSTRSRVIRLYALPHLLDVLASALFLPPSATRRHLRCSMPVPAAIWTLKDHYLHHVQPNSVWAVYKTHDEAVLALSLFSPTLSVTAALEIELEPFNKLRSVDVPTSILSQRTSENQERSLTSQLTIESSIHTPDCTTIMATISSMPDMPARQWICSPPKCAAHDFGHGLDYPGCRCFRPGKDASLLLQNRQQFTTDSTASPRFASFPGQLAPLPTFQQPVYDKQARLASYSFLPQSTQRNQNFPSSPGPLVKQAHPLLTPSGRAFAIGGRVRNISNDPLSPCIMYWPDNEPLPEQGQIRPGNLAGLPQPPILNTGNKGPISHQPGDWVCLKCNYLNWRRRKVCQTCLPYAEGNGDSISAAVQAERIALLTSVLAQTQNQLYNGAQLRTTPSFSPPLEQTCPLNGLPPQARATAPRPLSHPEQFSNNRPIYQTSGHRPPSPLYSTGPDRVAPAPAPLLPSFLQDIVQSPTLSPASSSSADLSFEEYDEIAPMKISFPLTHGGEDPVNGSPPYGNIWRLDGDECKSLSGFALPNHQELLGVGGKHDRDSLRCTFLSL